MKFSNVIKQLSNEEKNSLLNYFLSEKEENITEELVKKVQTMMSAEELRNANNTDSEIFPSDEDKLSLTEKEKEMIQKSLEKHNGDLKNAAKDLGINVITLKRKKVQYRL